ncbi:hypothetical protein NEOLEDRAFT_1133903 [Neolentinus lepideus HHB14362 ss-1]|uniref:Uncharacterized protein n=1 Tax=Neolentinus lepideus HHB14362 ss-1 TaxID=1314782 RepID=A0A165SH16_9AGAM|nr:hypothetical protein NEOLEDRAFT_1133903 [Neolentinus lepideus HHB14362 ss-1]
MARTSGIKQSICLSALSEGKKPTRRARSSSSKRTTRKPKASDSPRERLKVWCPGCGKRLGQLWCWNRHLEAKAMDKECVLIHEYQDTQSRENIPRPSYHPVSREEREATKAKFPKCRARKDDCPTWEQREEANAKRQTAEERRGVRQERSVGARRSSWSPSSSDEIVEQEIRRRRSSRARKLRYESVADTGFEVGSSSDGESDNSGSVEEMDSDKQVLSWEQDEHWREADGESTCDIDPVEDEYVARVPDREPDFAPDSISRRNTGPFRTQYRIDWYGRLVKVQSGGNAWMGRLGRH